MTPQTFERELQTRLGAHYRLRWSDEFKRWCIEHKVARPGEAPGDSDRAIRLRDGYHLVLETEATNIFKCPSCRRGISLEPFTKTEVRCQFCYETMGLKRFHTVAYFPLVDATLEWLEWCHPRRGFALDREIEEANARLQRARERDRETYARAYAADHWRFVGGVPRVGYTRSGTPHSYGNYLS